MRGTLEICTILLQRSRIGSLRLESPRHDRCLPVIDPVCPKKVCAATTLPAIYLRHALNDNYFCCIHLGMQDDTNRAGVRGSERSHILNGKPLSGRDYVGPIPLSAMIGKKTPKQLISKLPRYRCHRRSRSAPTPSGSGKSMTLRLTAG